MQGIQFWSLVRELKSHMLRTVARKKTKLHFPWENYQAISHLHYKLNYSISYFPSDVYMRREKRPVYMRIWEFGWWRGKWGRRRKGCVELCTLQKKSGVAGCHSGALKPEEVVWHSTCVCGMFTDDKGTRRSYLQKYFLGQRSCVFELVLARVCNLWVGSICSALTCIPEKWTFYLEAVRKRNLKNKTEKPPRSELYL